MTMKWRQTLPADRPTGLGHLLHRTGKFPAAMGGRTWIRQNKTYHILTRAHTHKPGCFPRTMQRRRQHNRASIHPHYGYYYASLTLCMIFTVTEWMKTHLGFLEEVLFGYLSYGVQVGTNVLLGHSCSLSSGEGCLLMWQGSNDNTVVSLAVCVLKLTLTSWSQHKNTSCAHWHLPHVIPDAWFGHIIV